MGAKTASKVNGPRNEILERRIAAFVAFLIKVGRSSQTAKTYGKTIQRVSKALDGSDPLDWDIESLKALLASPSWAGWSPATRHLTKAALMAYWKINEITPPKCLEFLMVRSPKLGASTNRTEILRSQCPTQKELDLVREYCRNTILEATKPLNVYNAFLTFLIAAYGLRCIDAASIRVGDIKIVENIIHIPKGKGDKARNVYLDIPLTNEMLERFMSARASLLMALKAYAKDPHAFTNIGILLDARVGTPLFFSKANRLIGPTQGDLSVSIQKTVPRVVQLALGRHINAHAFRHGKAFELLEKGIAIETVAQYLGHASIQQTMEYRWAEIDAQRSAFNKIENGKSDPAPSPIPPSAPGNVQDTIRTLATLLKEGILSESAFAKAISALNRVDGNF